jgi:hypothetical protein
MKIWHDDVREPPDETWVWARTNKEAIYLLLVAGQQGIAITEMSLDHDLGLHEMSFTEKALRYKGNSPDGDGVDLVQAMCALRLVPPKVTVHSWNPEGAARMVGMLEGMSDAEVTRRAYEPRDLDDEDRRIMRAMGL